MAQGFYRVFRPRRLECVYFRISRVRGWSRDTPDTGHDGSRFGRPLDGRNAPGAVIRLSAVEPPEPTLCGNSAQSSRDDAHGALRSEIPRKLHAEFLAFVVHKVSAATCLSGNLRLPRHLDDDRLG